jgi:hypothetical protein
MSWPKFVVSSATSATATNIRQDNMRHFNKGVHIIRRYDMISYLIFDKEEFGEGGVDALLRRNDE